MRNFVFKTWGTTCICAILSDRVVQVFQNEVDVWNMAMEENFEKKLEVIVISIDERECNTDIKEEHLKGNQRITFWKQILKYMRTVCL